MSPLKPNFIVLLITISVMFGGCGKGDNKKAEEKKAPSQVAAKVNAVEITVSQINNVLSRTPNVTPEVANQAKREILNKLVDQELAKEQAIALKLDRSPNVVQAMEAAKSEILARAYVEQIAATQPRPTAEEIKKYYADHPELFAQRHVFEIEEIIVAPKEGNAAAVTAQAAKARSMQEIADWLKTTGVKFAANRAVRAAEQIPLDALPALQAMKVGEIRVTQTPAGGQQIVRMVASKPAPVDEATATAAIQQFLSNRRASEAVVNEMKLIKEKAKIEYIGEFGGDAKAADAKAKADAEARAKEKAVADAKAKADAEAQARSDELSRARAAAEAKAKLEAESKATQPKAPPPPVPNVEKGIRGL